MRLGFIDMDVRGRRASNVFRLTSDGRRLVATVVALVAESVEQEFERTLTAYDLSKLKSRVVVMDTFATCDELTNYGQIRGRYQFRSVLFHRIA